MNRQFFKITLTILMVSGFASGCSVSTSDGGNPQGPLKMTLPQTDCLARALPVVQSYFQGTSQLSEMGEAWNCANDAVTMFESNTQGANPDHYTPKEIRSFLEQFFLGDIKISDSLLSETMRLKQVLLGGSIDKITRAELVQAQRVIQVLRVESQRNHPYIGILMGMMSRDDAQKDTARVEVALQNLHISAINLGALFGHAGVVYETKDLKNFLNAVKPLFKNWKGPENIIKFIPTFELAKSVLLNAPGGKMTASDWQPLFTNASKLYAVYLRSHYLMSGHNLMVGEGLKQLKQTVEEVAGIVKNAIDVKASKTIGFSYLDEIVDEMNRLELLDLGVRDTTTKHMIRVAFNKLFNSKESKARKKVDGLTLPVFNRLYSQIMGWLEMQAVWEQVEAQALNEDPRLKGQAIPLKILRRLWPAQTVVHKQAHEDIRRLLNRENPIVFAANGTVVFERGTGYQAFSQATFNQLNWKATIVRTAMDAYPARIDKDRYAGISKPEMKEFFDDVHELGTDLNYVEPTDNVLWDTSFDEANMFMLSAENNDKMSYHEAFDFLSVVLGGSVMQKRLYDELKERCAQAGKDYFGRKTVSPECMHKLHKETFAATYRELPNWVRLAKSLDDKAFVEFQNQLELATREGGITAKPFGISDITRMTMVMQYIESFYTRFDEDSSGTITYAEAEKAFPLLKDILKQASGLKTDKSNFGLFCYLLRYGHAPNSIGDKAYFAVIWLKSQGKWKKVSADRLKVLGIVASLKKAAK